ncbi:MAG: hypothetical protein ACLTDX_13520 [[Clostridium] innocuum]
MNLPKIPGGKKLIYPHIDLPLTAIEDFRSKQHEYPVFKKGWRIYVRRTIMYGAKRQRNICLIIIRSEKENDEPHSMEIKFRDGVFMMLRCDVF